MSTAVCSTPRRILGKSQIKDPLKSAWVRRAGMISHVPHSARVADWQHHRRPKAPKQRVDSRRSCALLRRGLVCAARPEGGAAVDTCGDVAEGNGPSFEGGDTDTICGRPLRPVAYNRGGSVRCYWQWLLHPDQGSASPTLAVASSNSDGAPPLALQRRRRRKRSRRLCVSSNVSHRTCRGWRHGPPVTRSGAGGASHRACLHTGRTCKTSAG